MHKQTHIIRGCWQLANGHSRNAANIEPILNALQAGFNTFDCADIYLGVEQLLGKVNAVLPNAKFNIHTKFVPDLDRLADIDTNYITQIIDRSRKRLQVDCLDLVQFHWWDFEIKNYLPTMEVLFKLKAQGKIKNIGLTNVNSQYLTEFSRHFEIYSLQSQVSLFDKRIERGILDVSRKNNIKIFAYGSLLGGFLSERWLNTAEPQLEHLPNRSLVKYKLLIDSACGWEEFQRRLKFLHDLSIRHQCKIANIAIAAILQQNKADKIISGLSPQNFAEQNQALRKIPMLNTYELEELDTWSCMLNGDSYDEERNKNSVHAKIMKYNLNDTA